MMSPCSSRGPPGCFQPRFLAASSRIRVIPSQDSEQRDFLVELADQLAPKFSHKKLNELICPAKVFVWASYTWRLVHYFCLPSLLQSRSFWPQMPRPFICWHEFMSGSLWENGDGQRENNKAEGNQGGDPVQASRFLEAQGSRDSPTYTVHSLFLPCGGSGYVYESDQSENRRWLLGLWLRSLVSMGKCSACANVNLLKSSRLR